MQNSRHGKIVESMEKTGGVATAAFTTQDTSTAASSRVLETGPAPSQEGLPSVVVLEIFQHLNLHSLLKCRQVCSGFQYLIDSTPSLQYEIELAVAGQQDGRSYGDILTRREMLKMHQRRWDGLQWTKVLRVPMMPNYWGLYGGVFAQTSPKSDALHLTRIPSQSRGIKEKNWILDLSTLLGKESIGFFGIDPGQDLLVIIASAGDGLRIHLLTLSKGECHPLTSEPCLLPHEDLGGAYWLYIDICHDYLSIRFEDTVDSAVLWNWKTGKVLMHIVDQKKNIASMVFLNERYVLMAIKKEKPFLLAVDFLAESPEQRGLYELENYFIFRFPDISHSSQLNNISVRSNSRSNFGTETDPSVPFSMVPQNRLFVVYILSTKIGEDLCFAILEASFLSLIKTGLLANNYSFDWSMWGPEHSRTLPNYSYSLKGITPSHGTRVAMKKHVPHRGMLVDVYDFNQLACRNKKQDSVVETPGNVNVSESSEIIQGGPVCVLAPTRIKANLFHDQVDTRLGYRVTSWFVPVKTHADSTSVMCSEDAVIIVDTNKKMYEIYTV